MQCLGLRPLAAVAISLHLAGCVLSIDAVVPESEAIFDEALLGTWEVENGPDRVTITRASESTYAVDFADDEVSGRFEARLGELDGQRVLDVWPAPSDTDPLEPYINLLVPGHVLFVLDVGGEDKVMYGSDYLLGLSTFAPDAFAARDAMRVDGHPGFFVLNDQIGRAHV